MGLFLFACLFVVSWTFNLPTPLTNPRYVRFPGVSGMVPGSPGRSPPFSAERFSRKVFVGGLPPDIDEGESSDQTRQMYHIIIFIWQKSDWWWWCVAEEITSSFRRFGALVVDWPHKAESKSYFPPKGYAFLLFQVIHLSILFLLNH